jgi:hypothetical protein
MIVSTLAYEDLEKFSLSYANLKRQASKKEDFVEAKVDKKH